MLIPELMCVCDTLRLKSCKYVHHPGVADPGIADMEENLLFFCPLSTSRRKEDVG